MTAQTRENFANIAILLDKAKRQHAPATSCTLQGLDYRVYVRHGAN